MSKGNEKGNEKGKEKGQTKHHEALEQSEDTRHSKSLEPSAEWVFEAGRSGVLLSEFQERTEKLSRAAFLESFNHPFLVCIAILPESERIKSLMTDSNLLPTRDMESDFMKCPVYPVVKKHPGRPDPILIGRAPSNDISFDYPTLSKVHAHFELEGKDWYVTDLSSLNGTFIDRVKLEPRRRYLLSSGRVVDFSPQVSFFFTEGETLYDDLLNPEP